MMATHKDKFIPKNYITTGISKNLLTPCRRIGLSRSKKTPKNINAVPLTPNIAVKSTVKNLEIRSDVNKKDTYFEETPKKLPTPEKAKKNINRTAFEKLETKIVMVEVSPEILKTRLDSNKVFTKSNDSVTVTKEKKRTFNKSPTQNVVKSLVTVEVHHPVAKRHINFNEIDESPNVSSTKERQSEQCGDNLTVTPVTAINISSKEQIEEKPFKAAISQKKKRKLELDRDDFGINKNPTEHENSPKTNFSPKNASIKKCRTTINENDNGFTLSRFTTEDYLKEYSSNPKIFEENLAIEGLILGPMGDDDIDAFDKSPKNLGNQKKTNVIVCPNMDQSIDVKKPIRSLSTKKSSLKLKKPPETATTPSELNVKYNLTVSLERLTKENLGSKLKNDEDIQLRELPATPELISSVTKVPFSKINIVEEDDELFTSSPEDEKKQRESLLKLILNIEKEIKQKEGRLEKLKQAQVYKNKHSPEKLKVSSDRWMEGCRSGLNDLLTKMQEHGPMEMDTLIKNLRIPVDILEKLNL